MPGLTEIRTFDCLIPAGTPIATPVTVSMAMPPRAVKRITARIPPGPGGTMGFAIGSAGRSIIPYDQTKWIVTDNEVIPWDVFDQIDSGAWELRGYNTDLFPHTVYVRFEVELPDPARNTAADQPIPIGQLSAPAVGVLYPIDPRGALINAGGDQ